MIERGVNEVGKWPFGKGFSIKVLSTVNWLKGLKRGPKRKEAKYRIYIIKKSQFTCFNNDGPSPFLVLLSFLCSDMKYICSFGVRIGENKRGSPNRNY